MITDDEIFVDDGEDCWEDCEDEVLFKMVYIVNTELGMGVGKVSSQVGHATLGLYRLLKDDIEKYGNSLKEWEETGEKKITLRGKSAQEIIELQKKAIDIDLPIYLVEDAGKTQIPDGAITVLAIFGDEDTVNQVTGSLKLL